MKVKMKINKASIMCLRKV